MKIKLGALRAAPKAADDNSVTLVERRATLIAEGQKVLTEIKALDEPDAEAVEAAKAAADQLKSLDAKIEKADASAVTLRRLGGLEAGRGGGTTGVDHGVRLNFKSAILTRSLSTKMAGNDPMAKAVAASGDAIVGTPLDSTVYESGRVGTSALDVLPVISRPVQCGYLRQTKRENNAAPVVPGDVKPTSQYGVTRIDGKLHVIAHLPELVDSYWLEDNTSLEGFVSTELQYGLQLAVEGQIVGGDGAGANVRGILNTSGFQSVAFAVDATTSVRRALTKIETVGHRATSII